MRSAETLDSFIEYCEAHPQERFWQALRNWSGYPFILASNEPPFNFPGDWKEGKQDLPLDTFYWEGRIGRSHE